METVNTQWVLTVTYIPTGTPLLYSVETGKMRLAPGHKAFEGSSPGSPARLALQGHWEE